ncbi:MAG TPA: insulinase family protein, partial [Myxococcota bacterium]|nr:insulinase family protein [Myxococcota bacterium]
MTTRRPTDPLVRRTLDNGLEILVAQSPHDACAVHLCVQAGAVDELAGEHGLAHLLEHMLFKGTARRAVGRSAADIERHGGDLNAWTSMDETTLHAVVAADGWRTALDVQADMLLRPTLDPEELRREIDVVIEELRSYDSEPESLLGDHVQRGAERVLLQEVVAVREAPDPHELAVGAFGRFGAGGAGAEQDADA